MGDWCCFLFVRRPTNLSNDVFLGKWKYFKRGFRKLHYRLIERLFFQKEIIMGLVDTSDVLDL